MLRAPTAVLLALCTLACFACKDKDEALSTEPLELLPADLHGTYGRTANDAPGMTVSASGLEFDEMKLVIHQGKLEGDTVRVERATLQWEKLEPKTCTGTIARLGDRLLLDLYEVGGAQGKCDSVLESEWSRWQPLAELPAPLHGRYDTFSEMMFSVSGKQLRLDLGWFKADMITSSIAQLPGSNDERVALLIDDAKVSFETDGVKVETTCTGTLELADGWLSTDFWVPRRFELEPGSAEANDPVAQAKLAEQRDSCEAWKGRAQKFEISMDGLPKAPIKKREVSLAITTEKVVLDSPALRCEQELWGTETVPTRHGVFGGQRMTLGKAEPSAVSEACRLNMRIWCERQEGNDNVDAATPPSEWVAECMQQQEHELCPATITVQAISDLRYKFAIEPFAFNEIACVDTSGDFALQE
jgi:hypothetical protein